MRDYLFATLLRGLGVVGAFLAPTFFGMSILAAVGVVMKSGFSDANAAVLLAITVIFAVWSAIGVRFAFTEAPRFLLFCAALLNACGGVGMYVVGVESLGLFLFGPLMLAWSFITFRRFMRPREKERRVVS